MAHAFVRTFAADQPTHLAIPARRPTVAPAAAALRARRGSVPHPPLQSTASLPQPAPPTPCAPASISQPSPRPPRSHIALAALPVSDRPVATKDHAPHPYSAHDTPQQYTESAPLSLQLRCYPTTHEDRHPPSTPAVDPDRSKAPVPAAPPVEHRHRRCNSPHS